MLDAGRERNCLVAELGMLYATAMRCRVPEDHVIYILEKSDRLL